MIDPQRAYSGDPATYCDAVHPEGHLCDLGVGHEGMHAAKLPGGWAEWR